MLLCHCVMICHDTNILIKDKNMFAVFKAYLKKSSLWWYKKYHEELIILSDGVMISVFEALLGGGGPCVCRHVGDVIHNAELPKQAQ